MDNRAGGPPPALGDLLAGPARRWPERPAIDDGTAHHTFAELEDGALRIAGWLAGQGVGPGDRVVVLTETRTVMPMIIAGIWKRGATYVPVDAAEPLPRLRKLLDRLRPAAVVTPAGREPVLPGVPMLDGEALVPLLAGPAAPHTTLAHGPGDAAYVVFASGATGEPQGAEITAEGLRAHFAGHNEVLRLTPDSRALGLSPFHFDVSLLDTLLPLSVGASVHQFRGLPAGAVLRSALARQRVTHLFAVTLMLGLITDDGRHITREKLPALDVVMTGAQVCPAPLLRIWADGLPGLRLVQAFGPPEATIFALTHTVRPDDLADPAGGAGAEGAAPCPVGRPLPGVLAKLVRDGAEVHGPGAEGELWIGGPQVTRGYFDQPEETARLVVEDGGTRWFRTGDLCAYDADGVLVLRRHADPRITWLAGRRTHLYEIERAALSCPGVDGATAVAARRAGRDTVALAVAAKDRRTLRDLTEHLRGLLPAPLLPAALVRTEPGREPDVPRLVRWLADPDPRPSSPYFDMSADGAVEPFDGDDKEEQ